jgi:hypothetical protein
MSDPWQEDAEAEDDWEEESTGSGDESLLEMDELDADDDPDLWDDDPDDDDI